MKAVVLGRERGAEVRDVPEPRAGRGEVVVEVDFCGICGSDLHAASIGFGNGIVMGHEFAGTVVDLGNAVEGWRAGDRVAVNPAGDWCGSCPKCLVGEHSWCDNLASRFVGVTRNGGMARYVAVPVSTLHRLPDGLETSVAAWAEPLAVVVRMVRLSGFAFGDEAVVFGAGPIGLLAIQILLDAGARSVVAVQPSALRAEAARRCGAARVIPPGGDEFEALCADRAGAPTHAYDCAGVASTTRDALRLLPNGGRLTVSGVSEVDPAYSAADLVHKEIVIRGSCIYRRDDFDTAIELLARRAVTVEHLVTDVRSLEDAEGAFADLRERGKAIKILLRD